MYRSLIIALMLAAFLITMPGCAEKIQLSLSEASEDQLNRDEVGLTRVKTVTLKNGTTVEFNERGGHYSQRRKRIVGSTVKGKAVAVRTTSITKCTMMFTKSKDCNSDVYSVVPRDIVHYLQSGSEDARPLYIKPDSVNKRPVLVREVIQSDGTKVALDKTGLQYDCIDGLWRGITNKGRILSWHDSEIASVLGTAEGDRSGNGMKILLFVLAFGVLVLAVAMISAQRAVSGGFGFSD